MADSTLWAGLYNDLRLRIERDELPAGAQVPRELELANQHGLSRTTVRQALTRLEADGLITPGRGRRGRQVRNQRPIAWNLHQFEQRNRRDDPNTGRDDWSTAIVDQGRAPRQEVTVTIEAASTDIASALEIDPGNMVVRRTRVRYVDDVAYQIATSWFPEHLVRDTILMREDDIAVPGGALRYIGAQQLSVRDQIYIRMPTSNETSQLDIPTGIPVGEHRRTGYGENSHPVRHMITIVPGDRHFLVYELDLA